MAIGLLVIPAMAIAFAISFAALVFKGPLEPFLGQGISLTLISAAILGLLGSFLFSFRGTISGPQDVTSILLGAAALAIVATMTTAAPADILGTTVVFIALGSITAGIASLVFGWLRLAIWPGSCPTL